MLTTCSGSPFLFSHLNAGFCSVSFCLIQNLQKSISKQSWKAKWFYLLLCVVTVLREALGFRWKRRAPVTFALWDKWLCCFTALPLMLQHNPKYRSKYRSRNAWIAFMGPVFFCRSYCWNAKPCSATNLSFSAYGGGLDGNSLLPSPPVQAPLWTH